ncbi:MAG: lysoplasmalogenase [Spirochaetales bacterium]|nr:lysoplasmalogenase [Spirochaetales bacterium]
MTVQLIPFLLFSLAHVFGEIIGSMKIRYFTKPLLMPLLALYYLAGNPDPSILMILAIAGGWLGDLFLMIPDPEKTRRWFKPGLVAFLLGHIFYMSVFFRASAGKIELTMPVIILAGFVLVYCALVFLKLKPYMGKLAPAITVYIVVIAAMGISAVLCLPGQELTPAVTVIAGAMIFMVSDTVNAWNKFAKEVPRERVITMTTYLAGQGLLVAGYLGFLL